MRSDRRAQKTGALPSVAPEGRLEIQVVERSPVTYVASPLHRPAARRRWLRRKCPGLLAQPRRLAASPVASDTLGQRLSRQLGVRAIGNQIPTRIRIQVHPTLQSDRILRQEPAAPLLRDFESAKSSITPR